MKADSPLTVAIRASRVNDEREIVQLPTQTFNDLVDYVRSLERDSLAEGTAPRPCSETQWARCNSEGCEKTCRHVLALTKDTR